MIASAAPGASRAAASTSVDLSSVFVGQARVVRALATRELALDDRDLDVGVESPKRADEVLAARAGAEHDDSSVGSSDGEGGI